MSYLLDTNALIWFATDSPVQSPAVDRVLADPNSIVAVSIMSLWEIAIKVSIGKLDVGRTLRDLETLVLDEGIAILDILVENLETLVLLPWRHKDPFDRMIAATALHSGLTVLSSDTIFDDYGVRREW